MLENIEDWARKNLKCCACGGTLDTSDILNVCVTNKVATWKFPVCGSLECPGYPPKAVAFVCDECMKNKVKIRHCIEWENSTALVTYHDIESLEDVSEALSKIKYYFGKKMGMSSAARNKLMLQAARQEGVN